MHEFGRHNRDRGADRRTYESIDHQDLGDQLTLEEIERVQIGKKQEN
jgi:hypothetical protein